MNDLAHAAERSAATRAEAESARAEDEATLHAAKATKALRALRVSAAAFACLPFAGAEVLADVARHYEAVGAWWCRHHGLEVARPKRARRRGRVPWPPAVPPKPRRVREDVPGQLLLWESATAEGDGPRPPAS